MRGLALASLALLLLAAWLFLPAGGPDETELGPAVRVCVVDASASARRRRPHAWLPWVRATLREESQAAEAAGLEFAVVVFASGARRRFGPGPPAEFRDALLGRGGPPFDPAEGAGAEDGSELAAALRTSLELALAPGRRPGEVVLLGEGDATGEDPLPLLAELWQRGATTRALAPPAPDRANLALRRLEVPAHVEAGAPLRARATLGWEPGGPVGTPEATGAGAELRIELRGSAGLRALTFPLLPPPNGGVWRQALDLGPAEFGRTDVTARVLLPGGPDPVPEDDLARASTKAEGELVVGVAATADRLAAARAWLAPAGPSGLPGVQFAFTDLAGLSRLLPSLDALVTFDVPLHHLDATLVGTFVRSGGGWFATAGWRFLFDWIPDQAPGDLHRLLPLEPASLEQGPRDVVLLMDGSGSMKGEPFDILRVASIELVASALPTDEVVLRFFTSALGPGKVIKDRRDAGIVAVDAAAEAARRLLNHRVPGGSTFLFASLEQFAAERRLQEEECLALLLTDGRERAAISDAHREERARAVLESLGESRTRLVAIGVGEDLDEWTLSLFTRPGEQLLRASALEDLKAIFRREVNGSQLDTDGPLPVLAARLPAQEVRSVARAAQGGAAGEPPPALAVAVRNRLRDGAEAVWIGEEGEPYLAVQRVGRGRTAQLSTCPIDEWAPGWAGRAGVGEPRWFDPLLRWLARREGQRIDEPIARVVDQDLVVDGLGDDWPAALEVRLLESEEGWQPADAEAGLPLTLLPPAAAAAADPRTRRTGRLPLDFRRRFAGAQVALHLTHPTGEDRLVPLDLGLGPEFRGTAPRLPFDDPRAGVRPADAPMAPGPGGQAHPAARGVLVAGLVLLTLAGLGRRLADRAIKPRP